MTSLYLAIFQREPSANEVELALRYVRANPTGTSLEAPPERPTAKSARERQREQRQAQRAAQQAGRPGGDQRPIGSTIENGGTLDAWTKLAHALFQANEAMFVN